MCLPREFSLVLQGICEPRVGDFQAIITEGPRVLWVLHAYLFPFYGKPVPMRATHVVLITQNADPASHIITSSHHHIITSSHHHIIMVVVVIIIIITHTRTHTCRHLEDLPHRACCTLSLRPHSKTKKRTIPPRTHITAHHHIITSSHHHIITSSHHQRTHITAHPK